jgi:DNA-binding NtrC family response regulator
LFPVFFRNFPAKLWVDDNDGSGQWVVYRKSNPWQGNVRELNNIITRVVLLSQSKPITRKIIEEQRRNSGHYCKKLNMLKKADSQT